MPRKRSPKLVSFRPDRERAQGVEVSLFEACGEITEQLGDNLAGFVMTGIDVFGDNLTRIYIAGGPVGHALLPSFIHDAVNRQLAIDAVVEDEESDSASG